MNTRLSAVLSEEGGSVGKGSASEVRQRTGGDRNDGD